MKREAEDIPKEDKEDAGQVFEEVSAPTKRCRSTLYSVFYLHVTASSVPPLTIYSQNIIYMFPQFPGRPNLHPWNLEAIVGL
jgi:hypothetical protein